MSFALIAFALYPMAVPFVPAAFARNPIAVPPDCLAELTPPMAVPKVPELAAMPIEVAPKPVAFDTEPTAVALYVKMLGLFSGTIPTTPTAFAPPPMATSPANVALADPLPLVTTDIEVIGVQVMTVVQGLCAICALAVSATKKDAPAANIETTAALESATANCRIADALPDTPNAAPANVAVLLRLPRAFVISEAATHAPSDSFQILLYDLFMIFRSLETED